MQSLCEIWHDFHFQGQSPCNVENIAALKQVFNLKMWWVILTSFLFSIFRLFCYVRTTMVTKYHLLMTWQFPLSLFSMLSNQVLHMHSTYILQCFKVQNMLYFWLYIFCICRFWSPYLHRNLFCKFCYCLFQLGLLHCQHWIQIHTN